MPGVNGFRAGFMGQILMGVLNGLSVPVKGIEITCAVVPEIENQITAYQLSGHWVVQLDRIFRVSRRSKNFPIAEIESASRNDQHRKWKSSQSGWKRSAPN